MKRILIYAALLAVTLAVPLQATDIGKLHPVELIQLYRDGDTIVICTDTGAAGKGSTVAHAVANLKATTTGIVFLDTAEYLLVEESAEEDYPQITQYLKPSVKVCRSTGEIDLHQAAVFLDIHRPALGLRDVKGIRNAPILKKQDTQMILKEF